MNDLMRDHESGRLYQIRGDAFRGFITGNGREGFQFLIVLQQPRFIVIQFSALGAMLGYDVKNMQTTLESGADIWAIEDAFGNMTDAELRLFLDSVAFEEGPIRIKKFFLEKYHIGIIDFPEYYQGILRNPLNYSQDERNLAIHTLDWWSKKGLFELWLNADTDVWINAEGEKEAS